MSEYFEGYDSSEDNSELSEIKKYNEYNEYSDENNDNTAIYKFTNKYSLGGIGCALICVIILLYIYFNYYKK